MVTTDETLAREILDRLTRLETLAVENSRQINERIDATNQRIDNINLAINQRIDDTNARITESNERLARLDARMDSMEARSTSRMDKLFYTMIGLGAAVIASLIAGQALD